MPGNTLEQVQLLVRLGKGKSVPVQLRIMEMHLHLEDPVFGDIFTEAFNLRKGMVSRVPQLCRNHDLDCRPIPADQRDFEIRQQVPEKKLFLERHDL